MPENISGPEELKTFATIKGHRYYVLSEWQGWAYRWAEPMTYTTSIIIGSQSPHTFTTESNGFNGIDWPKTIEYSTIFTATSSSTSVDRDYYIYNCSQGQNTVKLKMFVDLTELENARGSQIDTNTFKSLYGEFYNSKTVNP